MGKNKKETFCNAYSYVAWEMFRKSEGNPYLIQESLREEELFKDQEREM